jgi:hypothetical protein
MGHEMIIVAQQFGAIQCYLHLARFHIHPFLWSLNAFLGFAQEAPPATPLGMEERLELSLAALLSSILA